MAHYVPSDGIGEMTGALSKKKEYSHIMTTRRKHFKDPLTGEVVGLGPKEIYEQNRRDLNEKPYSDNEKRSHGEWSVTCREALAIIKDKTHPLYMEFYTRWRAQLNSPNSIPQFPNFVRHVLRTEG